MEEGAVIFGDEVGGQDVECKYQHEDENLELKLLHDIIYRLRICCSEQYYDGTVRMGD